MLKDISVGILEPGGLHRAGDVNVALPSHVRHVVVLEVHASAFQRMHELFTSSASQVAAVALFVPENCERYTNNIDRPVLNVSASWFSSINGNPSVFS
jgi:hypothetical protein